jgi:hypothetical protein
MVLSSGGRPRKRSLALGPHVNKHSQLRAHASDVILSPGTPHLLVSRPRSARRPVKSEPKLRCLRASRYLPKLDRVTTRRDGGSASGGFFRFLLQRNWKHSPIRIQDHCASVSAALRNGASGSNAGGCQNRASAGPYKITEAENAVAVQSKAQLYGHYIGARRRQSRSLD